MSNHIFAYGWSGHILVSDNESKGNVNANVVAVPDDIFVRLVSDYELHVEHEYIEAESLGFDCREEPISVMATGSGFARGFTHFGTVFTEAEDRLGGPMAIDHDANYLAAMKKIYGLDLPPCRLMIGCSSEH